MSYLIKFLLIVSFLLFSGCSTKSYYGGGFRHYKPLKNHKINNSPAVQRATMRPYKVGGKSYYPTVVSTGTTYRGIASWYGPNFHGRKTSNGEWYDMYAMTAAHKTLPMNTIVKVTNLLNGKSAVVRINDRGPFVSNRIIDLSYAAAKKIDMIKSGTAPVRLEVLGFNGKITTAVNKKETIRLDNFSVQIGSFRRKEGAHIYKNRYDNYNGIYHTVVVKTTLNGEPMYRVWLNGFKSENEARDFIKRGYFAGAFIIRK